jgi:hypothetical protein
MWQLSAHFVSRICWFPTDGKRPDMFIGRIAMASE